MSTEDRSVTFIISATDYVAANRLHMLQNYRQRGSLIFLGVVFALYVVFLLSPDRFMIPGVPAFVHHLPFLLLLLFMPLLGYFVIAPRAARSAYRQQKTLQKPLMFQWSEAGLRTSGEGGDWTLRWEDYLKWYENDAVFLLYQGPRLFQMIPKRVLTPAQIDDLRACMTSSGGAEGA